ncbi:BrnT family toxin [Roseiflexus castenholzii]|jgi:uncharacterized DUF497 family protein|uniref:BrnT family toxin n=1 Tax=Roseiflexus castenholzii (strain DSM 13941 / HLO8) TaxID=383372 RepID=A7NN80_ROSCS|nr:BrnT family toxin [Roseiflexus castenholzii]ABU59013.1 protein of unknown function DUF497 [Roseiflexus castenholzii DSM 13941]
MSLRFEWDEAKSVANLNKHGVSFDEAQTVFGDPDAITLLDDRHSDVEDRFIDIGKSASGRILVVVYTENDMRIRIISCRRATPKERRQYERRDGETTR